MSDSQQEFTHPAFPGVTFNVVITEEMKQQAMEEYIERNNLEVLFRKSSEHVILVAFDVSAYTRQDAHKLLVQTLVENINPVLTGGIGIDSWWVAEDDRTDNSDCDSAIFVPMGAQETAQRALAALNNKEQE